MILWANGAKHVTATKTPSLSGLLNKQFGDYLECYDGYQTDKLLIIFLAAADG